MDGAEGQQALAGGLQGDGEVVDLVHLAGVGDHGQGDAAVHAGAGHGGQQAGAGAVVVGDDAAAGLQLGQGAGGQGIGEAMGVHIDQHKKTSILLFR